MKPITEVKYFLSNEDESIKFELIYGIKYLVKYKEKEEYKEDILCFIGIDMTGVFHGRNAEFKIIHINSSDILSVSECR